MLTMNMILMNDFILNDNVDITNNEAECLDYGRHLAFLTYLQDLHVQPFPTPLHLAAFSVSIDRTLVHHSS